MIRIYEKSNHFGQSPIKSNEFFFNDAHSNFVGCDYGACKEFFTVNNFAVVVVNLE